MTKKIGAITIGQSPRIDVVPELLPLLGSVELVERGALDGLSKREIAAFAPKDDDYILVTRLEDGSSVRIAEKHILPRIETHIAALAAEGAAGILMLCTGEFPQFQCTIPLLYPQVLLRHFVAGVIGQQTLGVLSPDASQIPQSIRRWQANDIAHVVAESATPYGDPVCVHSAALALKERGAQLIVLDCIGYTQAMKAAIQEQTHLPVVLPRTVAARTLAELFDISHLR